MPIVPVQTLKLESEAPSMTVKTAVVGLVTTLKKIARWLIIIGLILYLIASVVLSLYRIYELPESLISSDNLISSIVESLLGLFQGIGVELIGAGIVLLVLEVLLVRVNDADIETLTNRLQRIDSANATISEQIGIARSELDHRLQKLESEVSELRGAVERQSGRGVILSRITRWIAGMFRWGNRDSD